MTKFSDVYKLFCTALKTAYDNSLLLAVVQYVHGMAMLKDFNVDIYNHVLSVHSDSVSESIETALNCLLTDDLF